MRNTYKWYTKLFSWFLKYPVLSCYLVNHKKKLGFPKRPLHTSPSPIPLLLPLLMLLIESSRHPCPPIFSHTSPPPPAIYTPDCQTDVTDITRIKGCKSQNSHFLAFKQFSCKERKSHTPVQVLHQIIVLPLPYGSQNW